jgi:hypothetical protein
VRTRLRRRRPRRRPHCGSWPRLRQPGPGKGPPTRTAPLLRCRCRCRVLLRGWRRHLKPRSAPLVAPPHRAHAHARARSTACDLSAPALRGHRAVPAAQATRGLRSSAGSACLRWALSSCSVCRDLIVLLSALLWGKRLAYVCSNKLWRFTGTWESKPRSASRSYSAGGIYVSTSLRNGLVCRLGRPVC